MGTSIAKQFQTKTVSEIRNASVSFVDMLDGSELLTGTPTVTELTTTDLTLTNAAINTVALTIDGDPVGLSQAVTFRISGGVANTFYSIQIVATTDAAVAQTLYGTVILQVIADNA